MKDVAGKVAFITGGASGIGLAMAHSFSAAGMKVVIADIEEAALQGATESFGNSNAGVITVQVDVTDRDAMADARQRTLDAFGKVHVLCNNAGVFINGNIADMTYNDWDWVMKVNIDGVINGIVTFIDDLKAHGEGGHIVNTASIAGQYGVPGLSVYVASKFALVGISVSMRADLANDNIRVSVLCPGVVATGIGSSERNRPDEFSGSATVMPQQRDGDPSDMTVMDPPEIGDMVLHAILNDQFYILTHPEFQPVLQRRSEELDASFDYWRDYRTQHLNH
jgi:NADP-dependent 3-hydroxy acid dehydrogenase YdfG